MPLKQAERKFKDRPALFKELIFSQFCTSFGRYILGRLFYKYWALSYIVRTASFIVRMVNLLYLYDKIIVRLGTFKWMPPYPVPPVTQVEVNDIGQNFMEPSTFTLIFQPTLHRF